MNHVMEFRLINIGCGASRRKRHPARMVMLGLAAWIVVAAGCRDRGPEARTADSGNGPRVISLAPNLTEMIVAIGAGDALVGRSSACDVPAAALADVPVVGGFGEPSLEALLSREPTLVVDVDLADQSLQHRMRQAGLRREHIPCNRLDDIPKALRSLGRLLDRESAAEELARTFENELAMLREQAAALPDAQRPLVFIELWSDPLMTVGGDSFISECVYLAGGKNFGDEQDSEYYYLSHEQIVARDPEVIVLLFMTEPGAAPRVAERIGWSGIRAVRDGRIHGDVDPDLLTRPGPRILHGIAHLRRVLAMDPAPAGELSP